MLEHLADKNAEAVVYLVNCIAELESAHEFKSVIRSISERRPKVRTRTVLDEGRCAWLLSHCRRERERERERAGERESVCV